jgi:diacylglycerol kinase (ATP)
VMKRAVFMQGPCDRRERESDIQYREIREVLRAPITCSLLLIYNPGSGRRRDRRQAVSEMVELLRGRGLTVDARATGGPGDATRLSRDALAAGADLVVVHGGDGTVNEAMQPLVGGSTPLAVWPGGTANVLMRELGLPRDPERVADMIATGRTQHVAVGRAGERYFLLMAGVGLDAALVRVVNPALKRLAGQGAFWFAAFQQFVRWEPRRFLVEVEGQRHAATFALLANAACYAGAMRIAPQASLASDHLDLCLIDWTDRRRFVRHARAGFTGTLAGLPGVAYLQVRRATALGNDAVSVQVDGELLGQLPMTFACVPAALSLVVP